MPIIVACPSCGAKLKAPETAAGKRMKCPRCHKPVAVPGKQPAQAERDAEDSAAAVLSEGTKPVVRPGAELPSERGEDENRAPDPPMAGPREPVAETLAEKICPECGVTSQPGSAFCPGCGTDLATGKRAQTAAGKSKWLMWALAGLAAVVLLSIGGFFLFKLSSVKQPDKQDQAKIDDTEQVSRSWQSFLANAKSSSRINQVKQAWVKAIPKGSLAVVFRSDDLIKSESVLTPYVGKVKLDILYSNQSTGFVDSCELKFGFKNGRWELIELVAERTNFAELNGEVIREKGNKTTTHDLSKAPYISMLFYGG